MLDESTFPKGSAATEGLLKYLDDLYAAVSTGDVQRSPVGLREK